MVKYWLKNRFLYDLIVSIALSLVMCFAFVFSSNNALKNNYLENSIYINSEIDFQIPNPSKEQIVEINNKEFVENTFSYYLTKTNVSGKKSSKVNVIMSDDMEKLSITMFNESTLVDSVSIVDNYACMDEVAASKLNVKCGDEMCVFISSKNIKFVVCAIYEENQLFSEGSVIVEFSGEIKSTYESVISSNSYSGAFINASNEADCDNYLKSYIPLGRLKDRTEFDSDDAYNTYNNAILSGNYSNEITKFYELRQNANQTNSKLEKDCLTMSILGALIIGIVYIVTSQILRNRKSENKYFKVIRKNKKSISTYHICSSLFSIIVYSVLTTLLLIVINAKQHLLITVLISIVLFVISMMFNIIQDKKYINNRG